MVFFTLFANLDRTDNAEIFEILLGFGLTLRFLVLVPWPFTVLLEAYLTLSRDGWALTPLSEDGAPRVDCCGLIKMDTLIRVVR